jgi:hypothetical protein
VDHPDAAKVLRALKSPDKHDLYGDSFVWRTTIHDKPQDLSEQEFEKWLWQRAVASGVLVEQAEYGGES